MKISLKNRYIGVVRLDAVTKESHVAALKVTSNPVESGALIADHAILQPKTITITGVIVDYVPPTQTDTFGLDAGALIRGGIGFLDDILAGTVTNITEQTAARAGQLLGSSGVSASLTGSVRALAPWLPDFVSLLTSDKSSSGQRIGLIYRQLLALQKAGETFEIQTGSHLYRNMVMENLTMEQTMDGVATVAITGKEVLIVSTGILSGVDVPVLGDSVSGRADTQSACVSQRGFVNTVLQ